MQKAAGDRGVCAGWRVHPQTNEATRGDDSRRADYRWVGVYKIIKDEFVIMAETGTDPATYARFPITQGLCGAALDSGKPVIVGDVSKDLRYLPTFHTTRSEIIVPMRNDHRHVLGMLDAESDKLNAFDDEDLQFLERAGGLIAHCLH